VEDGVVTEGASATAWIVKGKTLISRPLSNKVLPGITRKAVLAFLAETGFTFEERDLHARRGARRRGGLHHLRDQPS
jgi:D-alanine transaminase